MTQRLQSTNRRYKPFVAHRVSEVLDSTSATWWQWLPTNDNVADDATRSTKRPTFNADSRWLRGPAFLRLAETNWPKPPAAESANTEEELPDEIRPRFVGVAITEITIDFARFTHYQQLWRTVGRIVRFAQNALAARRGKARRGEAKRRGGELDVEELESATRILYRIAQSEGFPTEYAALVAGNEIEKCSDVLDVL